MKKISCFLIILGCVVLISASQLWAGIMVQPTVVEKSARPGESFSGEYKVINNGKATVLVTIEPEDWLARYLKKENTVHPKEWISFSEMQFEIEAGEFKKIAYTVTVPKDMEEEQAAQIFFSFRDEDKSESLRTRLGVVFYLGNTRETKINAEIEDFLFEVLPVPEKENSFDVNFRIMIKNDSNVHIRPFGKIYLQQDGKDKVVLKINPERSIYPDRSEALAAYVREVPLKKGVTYDAIASISCDMYEKTKVLTSKQSITVE